MKRLLLLPILISLLVLPLAACGGAVAYVGALAVPAAGTPPTLVVIRKESPTPARFPRRAGIPAKHPLRY